MTREEVKKEYLNKIADLLEAQYIQSQKEKIEMLNRIRKEIDEKRETTKINLAGVIVPTQPYIQLDEVSIILNKIQKEIKSNEEKKE
jgi:hypothetical protein